MPAAHGLASWLLAYSLILAFNPFAADWQCMLRFWGNNTLEPAMPLDLDVGADTRRGQRGALMAFAVLPLLGALDSLQWVPC